MKKKDTKTGKFHEMVGPRDGVRELGYHPKKQDKPTKNPPNGGITINSPQQKSIPVKKDKSTKT